MTERRQTAWQHLSEWLGISLTILLGPISVLITILGERLAKAVRRWRARTA
jgi:hypothetical protein